VDEVLVPVVDDGSTDRTIAAAFAAGADYVARHACNRRLAACRLACRRRYAWARTPSRTLLSTGRHRRFIEASQAGRADPIDDAMIQKPGRSVRSGERRQRSAMVRQRGPEPRTVVPLPLQR
jgi:glycosyltransferase involved in cell wall biosynthesis